MNKREYIISLIFLLFTYGDTIANDTTVFSDGAEMQRILYVSIFEDKTGKLAFEHVKDSGQFLKSEKSIPNLEVSSSTFWIKFKIQNLSSYDNLSLFLEAPTIDEVELYSSTKQGKTEIFMLGENKLFSQREYNDPNYIFDISIPKGETREYILKVNSIEQMMIPLSVGTRDQVQSIIAENNVIFGLYCGFILVMFFYNLFVYFTTRDNSYLYYITYLIFIGLTQIALKGYTFKYLWPDSPWLTNYSIVILSSIASIAAMLFIRSFLLTAQHTPRLDKGLDVINVIFFLAIVLSVLNFGELSFKIMQLNTLICSFYGLFIGYKIARKGYRPAKFFLLAWSILLIGAIIFVFKDFGLIVFNRFTNYTLQIASALETIFLSFALADRINILKKEKEVSQAQALGALEENKRIIVQQNIVLEQKVKDRTHELIRSNEELAKVIKDLKDAQSQLVQSEKMASLGQLTAGVAHEINNPINFVSSSIKPLKRDFNDILSILSKYEEVSQENFTQKSIEVNDLKKELDIEYLKEEINSLLKGIDEGASRTAEIVKGLRTFSRVDEIDLKRVDINEGIESTLILLSSMMGDKIMVKKELGDISKVECFPGKINQVFMNIINNAIHAITKRKYERNEGIIIIKTSEKDDKVVISIKDNGTGIPEELKTKIFDPFFTTKDVGEGTGLGLSIVYNIVESHNGSIDVKSELGKGTEFVIALPKIQTHI
ncbi:MAG: GHKL domain-containing protein [Cytophagaceae bacterium]|nr:GHKL domain-containing protein [Cytophagaceae bacterium]